MLDETGGKCISDKIQLFCSSSIHLHCVNKNDLPGDILKGKRAFAATAVQQIVRWLAWTWTQDHGDGGDGDDDGDNGDGGDGGDDGIDGDNGDKDDYQPSGEISLSRLCSIEQISISTKHSYTIYTLYIKLHLIFLGWFADRLFGA